MMSMIILKMMITCYGLPAGAATLQRNSKLRNILLQRTPTPDNHHWYACHHYYQRPRPSSPSSSFLTSLSSPPSSSFFTVVFATAPGDLIILSIVCIRLALVVVIVHLSHISATSSSSNFLQRPNTSTLSSSGSASISLNAT